MTTVSPLRVCPACTNKRSCAPLRCYCGHPVCPAFESYVDALGRAEK